MKHLDEEQLINALMGEPTSAEERLHLETCEVCTESYDTLTLGLEAAQSVKPRIPLSTVPVISFDKFNKQQKNSRMTWMAVAAMFLLAILGLRVNISGSGVMIQFALFHNEASVDEARIAEMEQRIYHALDAQSVLAQDQMDARFNAFFMDQDQEMGEFSSVVNRNINQTTLENAQKMLAMEKELYRQGQTKTSRGQMR